MITFHYSNERIKNVAGEYNELTGKQLIAIASILNKEFPEDVAKLKILKVLLNKSLYTFSLIPLNAKAAMFEHIGWVFAKNTLTAQLIPSYTIKGRRKVLHGAAGAFDNLTMGEWNACEIFYDQFIHKEGEGNEELDKLVAVLYRRPKKNYNVELDTDGDIRVAFNANEIDYHVNTVKHWPFNVKMAILFWYNGCRQHLKDLYDLFDKPADGDVTDPGMFELIRGLCGKHYGTFREVEGLNVHIVMRELEVLKKEAAEIEMQMRK
jgi:hypothetical protein